MLKIFSTKGQKGFTLIELMIVIAIIGILAAIAIPQFTAYKKRGYIATIVSDAKNAHAAATAHCSATGVTTVATGDLAAAGYNQSTGIATVLAGNCAAFTITSTGAGWGLTTNNAVITQDGTITTSPAI